LQQCALSAPLKSLTCDLFRLIRYSRLGMTTPLVNPP
jgi:hypothetical protein